MLCNDFTIDLNKKEIDNPFFFSNLTTWEEKKLLSVDDKWLKLLKKKKDIIDNNLPIKETKVYVIDNEYTIKYIDPEYLSKTLELSATDTKKLEPWQVRDMLLGFIDKWLLTDYQYQLVFAIIKYFDISKVWLLYLKEWVSKWINKIKKNTEKERYKYYKDLLQLPFFTYYREVKNFAEVNKLDLDLVKKELDNYTIKKQIDAWYVNEDLPNKYLPLVARSSFVDPEWKDFTPSIWQSYFMYHETEKKINMVVSTRQAGKSLVSSIVWLLALLSKKRWDVLFVVPSEEFIYQPMQYFERFAQKFKKNWLINIKKSENTIECPLTWNSLKFVSSLSKSWARSQSAPFIIFDEASYIKDEVFERALPIFLGKWGKFYAFSTINWTQKRDNTEWFFKWSKWIELWKKYDLGNWDELNLSDIGNVYRITVDEVEWKDPIETHLLKMSLKDKPDKYFAELYATLPVSDGLFTTEGFWISPELYNKKYYSLKNQFIIGYDPAKLQDIWWVIVLDATNWVIVEEHPLKHINYLQQIEILKGLIAKYNNAQLVFDRTRDETTYEILIERWIRPISIKYTAGWEAKRNPKDWWSYNVPKKVLVDTFEMLVEKKKLYALWNLNLLQEEISNFKAFQTSAWNVKYEAQTWTDDTINATFVATFYYNILLKNNTKFAKQNINHYDNEKMLRRKYWNKDNHNERYKKFIY